MFRCWQWQMLHGKIHCFHLCLSHPIKCPRISQASEYRQETIMACSPFWSPQHNHGMKKCTSKILTIFAHNHNATRVSLYHLACVLNQQIIPCHLASIEDNSGDLFPQPTCLYDKATPCSRNISPWISIALYKDRFFSFWITHALTHFLDAFGCDIVPIPP